MSDLQTDVVVNGTEISGTLKHVTGYTGFSTDPAEQQGNYLCLKFNTMPTDAITTVELVGGTKGPVVLDSDMNMVLLIKDKDAQTVKVTVDDGDEQLTKIYSLAGLTLESAE